MDSKAPTTRSPPPVPAPPTRWATPSAAFDSDETDLVITGGTEAAITRMGLAAFQNMKALSTRNDDPAGGESSV